MRSLLHAGLVTVVVFALASAGCGGNQPAKGDKADKGDGAAPAGARNPDFTVTALAFSREFLDDEKKAAAKYQGKVVEVAGDVAGVSTPDSGKTAIVQLEGAKKKETDIVGILVQFALRPESTRTGLYLSRKQKVKITADFERAFGASIINLTNGALEEVTKSEVVAIDAPDLAREFTKDPKAAEQKYAKKEMIVTGEVADFKEKAGFHYAKLKGDGKTGVSVTVGADAAKLLAPGKTVSLRAELSFEPFENNEAALQGGSVVGIK